MLTLAIIREKPEEVIQRLKVKNFHAEEIVNRILALDKNRRSLQQLQDSRQSELNTLSRQIGTLLQQGRKEEAEASRQKTADIKEEIKKFSQQSEAHEEELNSLLVQLPNMPHSSVPEGRSAEDNLTVREGGKKPVLAEGALPHWDLAKKYDIIDFELGNKITGAGFPLYKGKGAKLQRALISYFLDENQKAGYTEFLPPLMVNPDSGFGTGQLPDKDSQMYFIGADNYTYELTFNHRVKLTGENRNIQLTRDFGSYGFSILQTSENKILIVSTLIIKNPVIPKEKHSEMIEMMDAVNQRRVVDIRIVSVPGI